jgi:serine/threonine protein kinase/Tfp pilus assembly protein PilF
MMLRHHVATVSFSSTLVDRLAEELRRRWHAGEQPVLEEYLARYPQLAEKPEAAVELIYEELCLRQEHGQTTAAADLLRRFPQWREQLLVVFECLHLLEAGPEPRGYPVPGEMLGDFRLLAELGRGAHGRVFLATQPALADRPVVLKVAPRSGDEHLSLARLQHTHIVPLYSMHHDPSRGLRALCMPYFGGATLAQLLELLQDQPPADRTGEHLLAALRQTQATAPIQIPVEGPACQFLARSSYERAVCWMGVCLAEALQYSHERGLIHLDVKPSNVLWTADGQPMLLDLHLARGPIAAGAPTPTWMGGTPAYMGPEHRHALMAVREGRSIAQGVDGRADLYSLGLLLCEALGGALPPHGSQALSWLKQRNPQVKAGLLDLLGKCLADDPRQRYCDAAALADALRGHLAGPRGPDLVHRTFPRRKPKRPALLGILLAVLLGAGGALAYIDHQAHQARVLLEAARQHLQRSEYAAARDALRRGQALAGSLPFHRDLVEVLRQELRLVDCGEATAALHHFVDRTQALWTNVLAGNCAYQRGCYEDALLAFTACVELAPQSGWCHYNRGLVYDARGQEDQALADYDRALQLEPRLAMAALNRAVLHGRAGRYEQALDDFRRALDAGADPALVHYDRALVRLEQGDRTAAVADLNKTLQYDPEHRQAHRLLESLRGQR